MYKILTILIRTSIAIPVMFITGLITFFGFEVPFWYSSFLAISVAGLSYWIGSVYFHFRFLKKNQLTSKEYRYIRRNLIEAKHKIRRIKKAFFSIRNFNLLKEMTALLRTTNKIYRVTKNEPKRFYQAEQFYFSHLDSVVELIEKYVLLYSQPTKRNETEKILHVTQHTLIDMKAKIDQDLYHMLSNDIEQLQFEVDYVKHTQKTKERLDNNE